MWEGSGGWPSITTVQCTCRYIIYFLDFRGQWILHMFELRLLLTYYRIIYDKNLYLAFVHASPVIRHSVCLLLFFFLGYWYNTTFVLCIIYHKILLYYWVNNVIKLHILLCVVVNNVIELNLNNKYLELCRDMLLKWWKIFNIKFKTIMF